jgi:kumamolisin
MIMPIIPGSDRAAPLYGAQAVGAVPPSERFEVTIRVRRRAPITGPVVPSFHANVKASQRTYLTRPRYANTHGASPGDIAAIEAFAQAQGLVVVESSSARRSVFVSGTAADFARAFSTTIQQFEHGGGTYRGRTGPLTVPANVAPLIEGIFGIDDRPIAMPHFQRQVLKRSFGIEHHAASNAAFLPTELARLYAFPPGANGRGQCIGIIELGGGYRKADIDAYFARLGIASPDIRTVRVDGARNAPSTPESADGEVMLDILVAAAVAPKAKIAVYFAPNTDKGFLDALTMAIHDTVNKPSVISISWGSAEANWTEQAMTSFDEALQTAAALGITVCAAAGDNGSDDGLIDGNAHVDFPASSPFMLACGGTKVVASGAAIISETVWNAASDSATGGGVSDFFPVPAYQNAAGIPASVNGGRRGRGVPDVAGNADPSTGYRVRIDGQDNVIGGTSAVAPLWAGLIALANQKLGHHVGFVNPQIYAGAGPASFRDIISGNNGAYAAGPGWDACTGWGSPIGTGLVQIL